MNDEKLYSISKKISGTIKSTTTDGIYRGFLKFLGRSHEYSPYFMKMTPRDLFKIFIYLISIKKNSPTLADTIFKNLEFISFIVTQNENHLEDCDTCNNGYVNCENCDGTGYIACDECNSSGNVDCPECEGSGTDDEGETCEECAGSGSVNCDDCEGRGETTCSWCAGDGVQSCDDCDGSGQVESENYVDYVKYHILSWDPKLNKIAKDMVELERPFMNINDFILKFEDSFIELSSKEEDAPLKNLEEDEVYFFDVSDDPPLSVSPGGFFINNEPTQFIQK